MDTFRDLLQAEFRAEFEYLVDTLPTNASVDPYNQRQIDEISMVVLHHTEVARSVTWQSVAIYHTASNKWSRIGYHIGIRYYAGRCIVSMLNDPETCSYHAHMIGNLHGLAVCFAGTFDKYKPWPAEVDALTRILRVARRWATWAPRLPVVGHGQVPGNQTDCPGKHLKEIIPMLNSETIIDDADLRKRIWDVAKGGQRIEPNPDSAIEKAMREQGHTPIGKELPVLDKNGAWAGVAQLGYYPGGNAVGLAFFATNITSDGQWQVHEVEQS